VGTKNPNLGTVQVSLMAIAKAISPVKTWAYVATLLCTTERTAKHRLANTREITADEIAKLLRSEDGIHFLVALMADARPSWWKTMLRMGVLGGIERRREADLQLLRNVADVSNQTSAELPAALMVQDSEFYGPVFDALDAVARRPRSTVDAPTGKGGRR